MKREEQEQRYERAKSHAADTLVGFMVGSRTSVETLEAIETSVLWRLVLEGQELQPSTMLRLMRNPL